MDYAFLAVAAICLSVGGGCNRAAPAAPETPIAKVTVTPVVSQETIDADEYVGKTEASEIVEVRSRLFGYLKSVDFKDGDFVEKDKTTLYTIEADEYDAIHKQSLSRIALAESKEELAKAKLARNDVLLKKQALSQEEYEESAAAYREAVASVNTAKADAERTAVDLKYTVIKAPISGRIDRSLVSAGNLLTGGMGSGTLLTKIVQEKPMYVYFDVDERSLLRYMRQRSTERESAPGSLRDQGIECFVQLADEKDYPHVGKLDFASSEVDAGTGTARVRAVLPNTDRALTSGMFVRVRVPTSKPYAALLIPERALLTDQSIKYVYVVGDDNVATRQTVELGPQKGEMRIVKSGVKEGDRVIVKGQQRVRPGQKVEAETQAPAEPRPSSSATPSGTAPAASAPPAADKS
jgi:RND family efflux transporter MFP subunit